jgi:hypothetical protein
MPPRTLRLEPYEVARARWPAAGHPLLAQHDDDEVVVYQAYHAGIAGEAVARQRLDVAGFGLGRMSWVKPSFLWMMYRCGWCTKDANQARVLALWLPRARFEELLARCAVTPYEARPGQTEEAWRRAIAATEVRVQWDPDRTPLGERDRARRAIQIGLSGETLRACASAWIREIQDVTPLVEAQRPFRTDPARLLVPVQTAMPVRDPVARRRAEVDEDGTTGR